MGLGRWHLGVRVGALAAGTAAWSFVLGQAVGLPLPGFFGSAAQAEPLSAAVRADFAPAIRSHDGVLHPDGRRVPVALRAEKSPPRTRLAGMLNPATQTSERAHATGPGASGRRPSGPPVAPPRAPSPSPTPPAPPATPSGGAPTSPPPPPPPSAEITPPGPLPPTPPLPPAPPLPVPVPPLPVPVPPVEPSPLPLPPLPLPPQPPVPRLP
jgi:hypothetical protein